MRREGEWKQTYSPISSEKLQVGVGGSIKLIASDDVNKNRGRNTRSGSVQGVFSKASGHWALGKLNIATRDSLVLTLNYVDAVGQEHVRPVVEV